MVPTSGSYWVRYVERPIYIPMGPRFSDRWLLTETRNEWYQKTLKHNKYMRPVPTNWRGGSHACLRNKYNLYKQVPERSEGNGAHRPEYLSKVSKVQDTLSTLVRE